MREVLNAIFYVLWTGCQWKALPKDLPPKSTVHFYFMLWDWDGTLERIHHALYVAVREQAGREASPDRGDHRLARAPRRAQKGALLDPQGFDAAKKVTGRKRHILVDTLGLLLERRRSCRRHSRPRRRRTGSDKRTRALFPFILRIFADAGYQGPRVALAAANTGSWIVEIVKRTS